MDALGSLLDRLGRLLRRLGDILRRLGSLLERLGLQNGAKTAQKKPFLTRTGSA